MEKMIQTVPTPKSLSEDLITIGIDVSKEYLDAARYPSGETIRVTNTQKDHAVLLRWINKRSKVVRVVFEATGSYHRGLEQRLIAAGVPFASLDAAIAEIMAADPILSRKRDILLSIPGLGVVTVQAFLADMPELGTMDESQAASLAGLAPITRQSGKWEGRSSIRGGRATLRQALYMPALVAMRYNPDLKRFYNRLVGNGKHAKLAIIAVMRKLVTIANALLRDDRLWLSKVACP